MSHWGMKEQWLVSQLPPDVLSAGLAKLWSPASTISFFQSLRLVSICEDWYVKCTGKLWALPSLGDKDMQSGNMLPLVGLVYKELAGDTCCEHVVWFKGCVWIGSS